MFLTERKLAARLNELKAYRYRDPIVIQSFAMEEGDDAVGAYPRGPSEDAETVTLGSRWGGRDRYVWLYTTVNIPSNWGDKQPVGRFRFGRTGGGTNSGFESLLFINGEPYQGVDSNHEEVWLPKGQAGKKLELAFRMWTGLEGGGPPREQVYELELAELAWLDEAADDLYFTGLAIWQAIEELPEDEPHRPELRRMLNEAFHEMDWTMPQSPSFYESCERAQKKLRSELAAKEKNHPVTIHCLGHTHIDVAWLWRLIHTREKAARSFSTVLRLMEQFPDYLFLQTQPQLYAYVKEDYPELYEQIKARIQEGQWEVEGSMWLEADCNIPSGESLVRQIVFGKRFIKEEFGRDCHVLWLPDVFGYSWALPQILKLAGISSFMTTKISWNQYNRMPHDTFWWRGLDGTDMLTHFITTPEPWNASDSWFYTYNGLIEAKTVLGAWKGYRDKAINKELLLAYGYGDGGGGVNRDMLELRRRLDEVPGLPHVKPGKAGAYFQQLNETVANAKEYVHRWDGELYLEYHRGTYTSQGLVKMHNRKLELALRSLEARAVAKTWHQGFRGYPAEALKKAWTIVLRNQFHDIIPGSSIREVYQDTEVEYAEAWAYVKAAEAELAGKTIGDGWSVWVPGSYEMPRLVHVPGLQADSLCFYNGAKRLPAQQVDDGWIVLLQAQAAVGSISLSVKQEAEERAPETAFVWRDGTLSTPFYEVEWNEAGQIAVLYDKEAERHVLPEGSAANVLQLFEDKPLAHDAWDIDLFYQEKAPCEPVFQGMEIIEIGALRAALRVSYTYHRTTIEQDILFYAHSKRIDFSTNVDWHEQRKLLKVAFPVDVRATTATYDIQFGNVERPTHWNTSWDMAKFESVSHQWADLAETGYGASLLNDCKYGYDIKGNVLRLSLLKGATYPDTEADQGKHAFTYAFYPHRGDWREANTQGEAWDLNEPLIAEQTEAVHKLFSVRFSHVHLDAIKKAEDTASTIIRLHEFEGRSGKAVIDWHGPAPKWREVNLMEEPLSDWQEGEITFAIKPYELKTIEVGGSVR
ncbi:alpha-mannosidase [Shouchella clausii]|nr:alpha-mannosidase [Shouchella clausii]